MNKIIDLKINTTQGTKKVDIQFAVTTIKTINTTGKIDTIVIDMIVIDSTHTTHMIDTIVTPKEGEGEDSNTIELTREMTGIVLPILGIMTEVTTMSVDDPMNGHGTTIEEVMTSEETITALGMKLLEALLVLMIMEEVTTLLLGVLIIADMDRDMPTLGPTAEEMIGTE